MNHSICNNIHSISNLKCLGIGVWSKCKICIMVAIDLTDLGKFMQSIVVSGLLSYRAWERLMRVEESNMCSQSNPVGGAHLFLLFLPYTIFLCLSWTIDALVNLLIIQAMKNIVIVMPPYKDKPPLVTVK